MERNNSNLRFCFLSAITGHGISCQQDMCVSNCCDWCCWVMWRNDNKAEKRRRRSEARSARCERSSARWNGGQVANRGTERISPTMLVPFEYQHRNWYYGQLVHPFRVYCGKIKSAICSYESYPSHLVKVKSVRDDSICPLPLDLLISRTINSRGQPQWLFIKPDGQNNILMALNTIIPSSPKIKREKASTCDVHKDKATA